MLGDKFMIMVIHLFFFFIWVMYDKLIATPITLFIPLSLKIQELVKNRKYLLCTLISLLPISIYYFSNCSSYGLLYTILIILTALTILSLLTFVVLHLIGFLDYILRTKSTDTTVISYIFYLIYLSYMTVIYFSSDKVVPIIYNFFSKILN